MAACRRKNARRHSIAIDDGTHKGAASGENPGGGLDTSGTDIWDNAKVSYTWWYSMADWSGTLTPEISTISNGWKVVIPAGIGGSEWQGQTHFTLDAPASAAKKYDFCVTLNSSAACTCTVKLAWEGNDKDHAFFYDGNVALSAYRGLLSWVVRPPSLQGSLGYELFFLSFF